MKLRILGSGSSGNCYLLENESTALIIECGIRFKDIIQALDFNLKKVAGVLVSHEHKDHCKAVNDVIKAGLNVFASYGTIEAMGINHSHRVTGCEAMKKFYINDFTVMPFDVKHDAKEPFGFLINHSDCGNVIFITDSYYVAYRFKDINQIIVEANYSSEIINERQAAGGIHNKYRDRVIQSHMSIETCIGLLKANDLSAVNNIVLIHLSDGNSHAADFKKQVEDLTGKTVTIADKGMEVNLGKTPF